MTVTEQDLIKRHASTATGGGIVAGGSFFLGKALEATAGADGALLTDWSAAADVVAPAGYGLGGVMIACAAASAAYTWSAGPRLRRKLGADGWIGPREMLSEAGAVGIKKNYANLRPDLGGNGKPGDYGQAVGRIVSGSPLVRGQRLYIPHNYGALVVGPPGSGKSQWLINRVLDLPGAGYVSTTKPELYEATKDLRQAAAGRVRLFNPRMLGGHVSDLGFDPASGCEHHAVAQARAAALVRGAAPSGENAEFWAQKAEEMLRCYLMAIALMDLDRSFLARWAADPADETPLTILESHPDRAPGGWVDTLRSYIHGDPRLLSNMTATLKSCTDFLTDDQVLRMCNPTPDQRVDVAQFLRERGTIYVVADKNDRRLRPLITALCEWIRAESRVVANGQALAPGLEFVLDEVAQTCPVPIQEWVAEDRGTGIGHTVVAQALSQLVDRYGPAAAKTIVGAMTMQVGLPGMSTEDLEHFAALAGTRQVVRVSTGESESQGGSSTSEHRQVVDEPVVTPAVLRQLPAWHAFVYGPARRAAVVKFEPGYKRVTRETKALERREAKAAATAARAAEREQAAAAATLATAAATGEAEE